MNEFGTLILKPLLLAYLTSAGTAKLNLTSEFEYSLECTRHCELYGASDSGLGLCSFRLASSRSHFLWMHQSQLLIPNQQHPRVMQRCAQLVSASLVGMQIALSGIFASFSRFVSARQQNAITELGARLLSPLDTFALTVAFTDASVGTPMRILCQKLIAILCKYFRFDAVTSVVSEVVICKTAKWSSTRHWG